MLILKQLLSERDQYCERGQLVIDMFHYYITLKESILFSIDNFDEAVAASKIVATVPKARSIFACSLRTSGCKYVDLSRYYNLTACRVTQLSLVGRYHCIKHLDGKVDEATIYKMFKPKGLIDLQFNVEAYIKEQEKFILESRLKIRELKKQYNLN